MSDTVAVAARLRSLDDQGLSRAIRASEVRPTSIKDYFDLAEALLEGPSIQLRLAHLDRTTLAAIAIVAGGAPTGLTTADVTARLAEFGTVVDEEKVASFLNEGVHLLLLDSDAPAGASAGDSASNTVGTTGNSTSADSNARKGANASASTKSTTTTSTTPPRFTAYAAVATQLDSWPAFGLPTLELLASPPPPAAAPVPTPESALRFADRVSAERAFSAITSITELLREIEREPARELAKGGIALPDSKRLANAMSVHLDGVRRLVEIAAESKLIARQSGTWLVTDTGSQWLLEPTPARWHSLAAAWLARLAPDLRHMLGTRSREVWGADLYSAVRWLYPAGALWRDALVDGVTHAAETLGITANEAPSRAGLILLVEGADAAALAMASHFPAEVSSVYLQHDLSIVAPGPLTAAVDARLRTIADVESRALASTYRVSAASVNRAMAAGETAGTVREFLASISVTGIPQPLDYLITETAARYGTLRVGSSGTGTYLRSDDDHVLETLLVDQSLSLLGLRRGDAGRLRSVFALDTVFWALSDARYPVAAENDAGKIVPLVRRSHARATVDTATDQVQLLLDRLRLHAGDVHNDAAWLSRQLDSAIRAKAALTVSVRMPSGEIVELQLEPASVSGGRLRARDRRSDIERTLPLSSITAIAPPA